MTNQLLRIRGLRTIFTTEDGTAAAVDGLDLDVQHGETLGLVGESGCGKSVTALTIMRLIPSPPGEIVSGEVLFEGTDLLKLSESAMRKIRGNDISMIFQEPMTSLNPVFKVQDQIAEVFRVHRDERRRGSAVRCSESGYPIARRPKDYPSMSGGMRQRS
jgi:ABC-type dipeptide/oligopeptide/nickel transport system ATPase component